MRKIVLLSLSSIFVFCSCIRNTSMKNVENSNPIAENNAEITNVEALSSDVETIAILDNWLTINVNEQLVLDKLGKPDDLGVNEYWGALGSYIQQWEYTKEGISLEMESDEKDSYKHIFSIAIKQPCKMSTQQAVCIGTSWDIVKKEYYSLIDAENTNDSTIVVGSIYEGTVFYFKDNVVSQIFIGGLAE